jgi:threonine synthase
MQTLAAMSIYNMDGYIKLNPAIGYIGLKELQNHPDAIGVFLETAQPYQVSLDTVEPAFKHKLPIPTQIESVLRKESWY